jgi:phage gpG-like protein
MAGTGVEVKFDSEYQKIIDALNAASSPVLQEVAHAGGLALQGVTAKAFQSETDPATGAKWEGRKHPAPQSKRLLYRSGALMRSIIFQDSPDGSVIIGSNLVYAGIHQSGGQTKAHEIRPRNKRALAFGGGVYTKVNHPGSKIPARPFLGVPRDFEREFFSDPAIQAALGIAAGGNK